MTESVLKQCGIAGRSVRWTADHVTKSNWYDRQSHRREDKRNQEKIRGDGRKWEEMRGDKRK